MPGSQVFFGLKFFSPYSMGIASRQERIPIGMDAQNHPAAGHKQRFKISSENARRGAVRFVSLASSSLDDLALVQAIYFLADSSAAGRILVGPIGFSHYTDTPACPLVSRQVGETIAGIPVCRE